MLKSISIKRTTMLVMLVCLLGAGHMLPGANLQEEAQASISTAELMKEYEDRDKKDFRHFVKKNMNRIADIWIADICELGIKEKNKAWLDIALVIAEVEDNKHSISYALYKLAEFSMYRAEYEKMYSYINLAYQVLQKHNDPELLRRMELIKNMMEVALKRRGKLSELIVKMKSLLGPEHDYALQELLSLGTAFDSLVEGNWIHFFKNIDYMITRSQKAEDFAGMGKGYQLKGLIYSEIGDFRKALKYLQKASDMFEKGGALSDQGITLLNRGSILRGIKEYSAALEMFEKAVKLFEQLGDSRRVADAYRGKGHVYFDIGAFRNTVQMYDLSIATYRKEHLASSMAEAMFEKGEIYSQTGDYPRAVQMYEEALRALGNSNPLYTTKAYMYMRKAFVHEKKEQYAKALSMFKKALASIDPKIDVKGAAYAFFGIAYNLVHLSLIDEAFPYFKMAVEKLEAARQKRAVPWMKGLFTERVFYVYSVAAEFMLNNGYPQEGFRIVEMINARMFNDRLAEGMTVLEKGLDPEIRQRQDFLVAQLSFLGKIIYEWPDEKGKDALQTAKDKYLALEQQLQELQVNIRQKNPLYSSVRYPVPASVEYIQEHILAENDVLLRYFVSHVQVYALLISKSGVEPVRLHVLKKDLDKGVNWYLLAVAAGDRGRMNAYGLSIYRKIFKPLEKALHKKHRLIIIPDGALEKIPFEALPVDEKNSHRPVYLLEKYRITYIQSASVLRTLREHYQRKGKIRSFTGFGDPVYDYENFQLGKPERGNPEPMTDEQFALMFRGKYDRAGGKWERLEGSGVEVRAIADLFKKYAGKSAIYLRDQATEEKAKSSAMKGYDVVHFSSHGVLDDAYQGLVLSQLPGTKEDGYLTMNEIMNCDYNAKLVVLSACKTGSGKMDRAEGVAGLTRAVMYAGTPAVVAGLWNVDDQATKELMVRFYTYMLEKNKTKEEALRQAKLDLLNSENYSSPYFWAAFVLYGE